MILGLDTDVVVNWALRGAPGHRAARKLIEHAVRVEGDRLGIVPQVLHEFIHVSTDPRRFQRPLTMEDAIQTADRLWNAPEVERIVPGPGVFSRTINLLGTLGLGRKRILDTALAATLEEAAVTRLATFNAQDFSIFAFLKVVVPKS